MAEYRVLRACFFNGSRYRQGAIVSLPDGDDFAIPEHFVPASVASPADEAGALSIVHRGFGKWAVVNDATGDEIESGLTKMEAQARAAEGV